MIDAKQVFDHATADYDRTRRLYIPCFDDFYGTALALIPYQSDEPFNILDLGAGTGLLSALVGGGMFINADQALGTTPENEQKYQQAWLAGMRGKGCPEPDIAVALERIKVDKTATLDDQLAWLRAVGFVAVDTWYKNYRFT